MHEKIVCDCPACDAHFVIAFDAHTIENEVTYCPFCGEKLYLKDEIPKAWYEEEDDEL